MNNIKINAVSRQIEISKAFEKRASRVGTREYEELVTALRDFPQFKIVMKTPTAKEYNHKGLTFEFMEKLIKYMTDNNQAAIDGFNNVKELCKGSNFHFSKPKEYFLLKYPNYKAFVEIVKELDNQEQAQKFNAIELVEERKAV